MSGIKNIFIIISLLYLVGCYEVSEDDLFEDFRQQVVVEAQINNLNQPYLFKVSYSAKPNDSVDFHPITNALIRVSDNNGNAELLKMQEPGIYILNEIQGEVDTEYSLLIHIDDENYEASEIMPKPAVISKTEIKYLDTFVPEDGHYIKLYIQKPSTKTSFYKLEVYKNSEIYNAYNDLILFDDSYAVDTIEYLVPYAFEINDTAMIDLHVISQNIYQYYFELSKQTNNTFRNLQPPMQNPPNNITNNALGYFQVSAITRINIVIK